VAPTANFRLATSRPVGAAESATGTDGVARAPNGIALPQEGGKSFRCREGKGLVRVCFHDKGMTAMGSAATAMGLPTGGGLGGVRGQTGSDEADDFERDGNHA